MKNGGAKLSAKTALLCMQRDDLMRNGAEEVTEVLFPDTLQVEDTACPLAYRFEPGHPLDGVTLTLPLHLLNRVNEARCVWLVPGMVRDKVAALLKGLPKGIRNRTVPVQEFVTAFLISAPMSSSLPFKGRAGVGMGSTDTSPIPHLTSPLKGEEQEGEYLTLTAALSTFIRNKLKETVAPEVWEKIELPAHLHMNYCVVDDAGQELAQGRNLAELKQKLGQAAQMTFAQGTATPFDREGITQWDFGDLPEKVSFNRGSQTLTGYPALVDEGENVSIHLFDTAQAANESMRGGVRRLLMLALKEQIKQLEKNIPNFNQLALQARNIMAPDVLKTDLLIAIADRAFIGEDELPRDEKAFIKQRDRARARLPAVAQGATRIATDIFTEYHALQSQLAQKMSHPLQTDLQTQLTHLVYPTS